MKISFVILIGTISNIFDGRFIKKHLVRQDFQQKSINPNNINGNIKSRILMMEKVNVPVFTIFSE